MPYQGAIPYNSTHTHLHFWWSNEACKHLLNITLKNVPSVEEPVPFRVILLYLTNQDFNFVQPTNLIFCNVVSVYPDVIISQ